MSAKLEKSDEELMESYQLGDAAAFEILYRRHSGRVLGFLAKKLAGRNDSNDLLQEIFFKLHRSKHQYNRTLPFAPWLFSITRSVLLDHVKKKNLESPTEAHELEALAIPVAQGSAGIPSEALNVLPVAQKDALSLRVYDAQTFTEIAAKLSTSPENARQLVSRGLRRLREILGEKKE